MLENWHIYSQKSSENGLFNCEDDSQNPFRLLQGDSKQMDWISPKGPEGRIILNSQPKEELDLEIENEDRLSEQKDQIDPIQSAKKSTNVDSNLRNEQILEDQEMEPIENEQFQKNFEKEIEPAVSESNRTLENEHPNQIVKKEGENGDIQPMEPVEINPDLNGKHPKITILKLCSPQI